MPSCPHPAQCCKVCTLRGNICIIVATCGAPATHVHVLVIERCCWLLLQDAARSVPHTRLADVFRDAPYNRTNFLLVSSSADQVMLTSTFRLPDPSGAPFRFRVTVCQGHRQPQMLDNVAMVLSCSWQQRRCLCPVQRWRRWTCGSTMPRTRAWASSTTSAASQWGRMHSCPRRQMWHAA